MISTSNKVSPNQPLIRMGSKNKKNKSKQQGQAVDKSKVAKIENKVVNTAEKASHTTKKKKKGKKEIIQTNTTGTPNTKGDVTANSKHMKMKKNTQEKTPISNKVKTENAKFEKKFNAVKGALSNSKKGSQTNDSIKKKKQNPVASVSKPTGQTDNDVTHKKAMKRIKWKQKQMERKLKRIEKRSGKGAEDTKNIKTKKVNKKGQTQASNAEIKSSDMSAQGGKPFQKIQVAKTAEEATSNWKKLQTSLPKGKHGDAASHKTGLKRKLPQEKIRNPKYRKVEDKLERSNDGTDKSEPEIWFDDVDEILLDRKISKPLRTVPDTDGTDDGNASTTRNPLVKQDAFKGLTKVIGMDCEMVGVGDGTDSVLARVSIVNHYGEPVYDKFVQPKEKVVDYRTHVSGVRPQDLEDAETFEVVQGEVAKILQGRLLVGHAIKNDLQVLYLGHPKKKIRDTSRYKKFKQLSGGRTPSLKKLSEKVLAVSVQEGEHNSVQDAQAAMRLYTMYRKQWEAEINQNKKSRNKIQPKKDS